MSDDLISRESVKRLTTKRNSIWNEVTDAEGRGLDEILDSIPSIDAVPVIRCGECKHSISWTDIDGTESYQCDETFDNFGYGAEVDEHHFCGYGERKES